MRSLMFKVQAISGDEWRRGGEAESFGPDPLFRNRVVALVVCVCVFLHALAVESAEETSEATGRQHSWLQSQQLNTDTHTEVW